MFHFHKDCLLQTGNCGSQRTTLGKFLVQIIPHLREVVCETDIDDDIVEKAKKSIHEIFAEVGEQGFRRLESEIIEEISNLGGYIIATGGGAILNHKNILNLKANGRIYYIDRPLSWLTTTSDRPLSSNREDLERLYNERHEIYKSTADVIVFAVDNLNENVDFILKSEA